MQPTDQEVELIAKAIATGRHGTIAPWRSFIADATAFIIAQRTYSQFDQLMIPNAG